uniref:Uncharacterized protein n=1 Tax=Arundo donax TaxID=35708 RepID=A0A0A9GWY6_ARUDO
MLIIGSLSHSSGFTLVSLAILTCNSSALTSFLSVYVSPGLILPLFLVLCL